jgi:hypothetical protein
MVRGATRHGLAQLDSTGTLMPWNPDVAGSVYVLELADDGVYVGGLFDAVSGVVRSNLAAIDANGAATPWNPRPNKPVFALSRANGWLYVGGEFTTLQGDTVSRSRLAAFNSDGELESWFGNGQAINGNVYSIAVMNNSTRTLPPTIYVGGSFSMIGSATRSNLAAISESGELLSWNPGANNAVFALTAANGAIYAGGAFSQVGGISRGRIAAIGTDGIVTGWNPNSGDTYDLVSSLAAASNVIYASGSFTSFGATQRKNIAALDITSGTPTSWAPSADRSVGSISVRGDRVFVSGSFSSLSGLPRSGFGVIEATGSGEIVP